MFYVIKNKKLYEYGDKVTYSWIYPNEARELKNVSKEEFEADRDKFIIENNELVVSRNYISIQAEKQKRQRIAEIKTELTELDNKTIRPLRAGETEKLAELEKQAEELREELQKLIDDEMLF